MKVAAIFPTQVKQDIEIDLSTEQPLGIAYVAQAAINAGHDVSLYYGQPSLEELMGFDILAFSSLTKDIPSTIGISAEAKKHNPKITAIVGGPHISGDPNFVLEDSIDYGVIGEGEQTFVELLEALKQNTKPDYVKGIVYSEGGEVIFTGRRERLDPTGVRPVRVDDFYGIYDVSLYYPAPSKRRFIPLISSRGCTQGCEFCDSGLIWGKKVKYRTPKDIQKEIEELYRDENDTFFFDDENQFLDRSITEETLRSLAGKGYNLSGCGDFRLVDSEMLMLLKQAGWTTLLWGVESVDFDVLKIEKKGSTPEKVYHKLKESEELGIFNQGLTMIGFEYETEKSIIEVGHELINYPIHQIRLTIVTPFFGTRFYKRLKEQGHSFDPDLSHWDTGHLVYDHRTISPERMIELQHEIVRNFYKSPQWDKRMTKMAKNFPKLKQSIDEFRSYILSHL